MKMVENMYMFTFMTVIGKVSVSEDGDGNICGVYLPNINLPIAEDRETDVISEAMNQIRRYFSGDRKTFDLPLSCEGTDFQRAVWSEISKIPYGETVSYSELAGRLGNPNSSRAVGAACGKNPLPIVVPCHRVVQASGNTGSYAGGSMMKKMLLDLEASDDDSIEERTP
ncbi:MAG TPA: methylated-DNA--[protein]-cysteine S-methyltransferase [Candidatus Methanomethylophilaceae archaeon]|nr:methylated-DNA--[protein]-cysteine S-methyltransferase [Candidatus Methanomethylophilaceae archaeon]